MRVIIPTCDKYIDILEAEKYTLDKFGGAELDVTLLGFKGPTFDMGSWKFVSLGEDTGPQNLSHDLWRFFEDFDDEFFIYGNDDIVAVDTLDLDLIDEMKKMMEDDPKIMKICITSATKNHYGGYDTFKDMGNYQYKVVPQNADYRLSLNASIWRTSYFKQYCKLGAGHWDWETRSVAKNDGAIILGTMGRYGLDFGHLFRLGNMTMSKDWHVSEYTKKHLSDEDVEHVQNIINKIKNK
jgi:hypothetical protein